MRITGDPHADFDARDRAQEKALAKYPRCVECGEPIQSEKHYYIDGRHYCTDCVEEVYTEEYEN